MKSSKQRLLIKARNFRHNQRDARERDALAAALSERDEDHPLYGEYVDWRTGDLIPNIEEDPRTMGLDIRASFQQWLAARGT